MNKQSLPTLEPRMAHHIHLEGVIQGVGFRPYVYHLATSLNLSGFVMNTPQGVDIEVEGNQNSLREFEERLPMEIPPHARVDRILIQVAAPQGRTAFEIKSSPRDGLRTLTVPPDLGMCVDCQRDIFDPANRRYLYPFTNCTHCGPRYSILRSLPYDRVNTTMAQFKMCARCEEEYGDPHNRRFHAQPNACPDCGPHIELWDKSGAILTTHQEALELAGQHLRSGKILALKGIGGFHLLVDARDDAAVRRLRDRKNRPDKPLAVLFPHLAEVRVHSRTTPAEDALLQSSRMPIVVLNRRNSSHLSSLVAPGNGTVGAMLPYSPLHALLMNQLGFPIVATSGNLSEDPICIDEVEAVKRLHSIADYFLIHNRPIARSVDDSVFHFVDGQPVPLRLSRGYAPVIFETAPDLPSGLAVGGHMKNTVAVISRGQIALSQHLGDLDTPESLKAFQLAQESLKTLYEIKPTFSATDLHPDYESTKWIQNRKLESQNIQAIQHHHAHIASVIAELQLRGPVLGVAWDGSGYGPDGTVWGGEFLLADEKSYHRIGCLKPFPLLGGEAAVREPRRVAASLLWEIFGESGVKMETIPAFLSFSPLERHLLKQMWIKKINSPLTSSVGRLFDGVSSLLGLRYVATFEGQAAVELEQAVDPDCEDVYDCPLEHQRDSGLRHLDWEPMIREIVREREEGVPLSVQAAKFHNTLVRAIATVVEESNESRIVLSGGCFQNRWLLERTIHRLRAMNREVYWNEKVPANDGGLALGQAFIAAHILKGEHPCA